MSLGQILVVEDERIPAFNLKKRLTELGYTVPSIAPSGALALSMIEQHKPDLVLMDIHIEGDIDGIETAKLIPQELLLPVIYLTAYSEEPTLQRAATTKPYGYLLKPFSERELHATIQMALERRKTEVALRESEAALRLSRANFRYLFMSNPLPMWVSDRITNQFLEVNEIASLAYGWTREEFLRKTIEDIRAPANAEATVKVPPAVQDGYLSESNICHRRNDGEIIVVDSFSHALEFEGRQAYLTVAVDVTQRNIAEEHLRQAQKMEAVGQLTGGIAHDFNNLLAVIQGNLELISEKISAEPIINEMIAAALQAAERGGSLTQRLLAYSRRQPLAPQVIALNDVVKGLIHLLERTLGYEIEIQTDIDSTTWPIHIDPPQLESALINLAVNARDAMPNGGRLTITASNVDLDSAYARLHDDVAPGPYVLLSVTDSGTGMSPSVVKQAFEPFFTTKPLGRGTGLGLSMVFGFVKQSGGHIKIHSELGRGTTIKMYLPRAIGTSAPVDEPRPAMNVKPSKGELVLVVEDDSAVRRLTLALLSQLGYRTLEASDGPVALAIIKQSPAPDLLLTDVSMPNGMNGFCLAKAAKEIVPGLKVLLMSGNPGDLLTEQNRDGARLILKPFKKMDLAAMIRAVLDGDA
ncbi:MAG: response regulator [Alphaproteobacteria bacterium]|nr:response regulator [Alphaproteobacteria bacterium]MBU0795800.1 response regulator [Alphaproteobacteria bacterium]MBU0886662.1 response regulator [Alphaproteobacteria bacterium]MBU1814517.1 response regulator [Alphaproteobacteria bacterium]